ncbi:hypothetical protein HPB48_002134 [Haemaphysalis longicornis]|uniref:Uncharacterized protein n=1 Tax=Haemaphysalis longicornis TaxID=44386 RepID=A0A9J6FJQ8_HAELO|nr:hypothetical protein HPB48_002134 [Haemaphysalis longicornis]
MPYRLHEIDLPYTTHELTDSHRTAQIQLLSRTHTGRYMLNTLNPSHNTPAPPDLSTHINMTPQRLTGRILARARLHATQRSPSDEFIYVDAVKHAEHAAHAITHIGPPSPLSDTLRTILTPEAEEAAIALEFTNNVGTSHKSTPPKML